MELLYKILIYMERYSTFKITTTTVLNIYIYIYISVVSIRKDIIISTYITVVDSDLLAR